MPRGKKDENDKTERRSGKFIIPEGESCYDPPEHYPDGAKRYLRYLARTRQVTTSISLAHIGGGIPGVWRGDPLDGGLEGFSEQEDEAREAFVDWQEGAFFNLAQQEKGMPAVTAGIFTLKSLRERDYAERKEVKHGGKVDVCWLDMFGEDD